ncbi:MAG: hypothetical protein H7841_08420 [Magnetospirillum sp. WYHS-4]
MLTDEYAAPIEIVWQGRPVAAVALTVVPHRSGGRRIVAADAEDRYWLLVETAGVLLSEPAGPPVILADAVDRAVGHLSGHSHGSVHGEATEIAVALLGALAQTGRLI